MVDGNAIEDDGDEVAVDDDSLVVPFSYGFQVTVFGTFEEINAAMELVVFEFGILRCAVVKYLDFYTCVCRGSFSWIMDAESVVAASRELEVEIKHVVAVGFFSDEVGALFRAGDDAVFDLVARASPSCEIFAVEEACEAVVSIEAREKG